MILKQSFAQDSYALLVIKEVIDKNSYVYMEIRVNNNETKQITQGDNQITNLFDEQGNPIGGWLYSSMDYCTKKEIELINEYINN